LPDAIRRARIVLPALVAAALLYAILTGALGGSTHAGAGTGWAHYRDGEHGFSVEYPPSWRRADFPLFPPIINPRSILAVSTFAIPRGAGRHECGVVPSQVLHRVGARGAAVLLTELYGPSRKLLRRTPPRPEVFRLNARPDKWMSGPSDVWRFDFRERDRLLTVAVVLGPRASPELRRDVLAVLDSLRFDRRSPGSTA
jgi:hypothetical protein